jgi:hypothetical protein
LDVDTVVLALLALALLVAGGVSLRPMLMPSPTPPPTLEDLTERRDREAALAEQEDALLDRRVLLDASRGTLGGDVQLDQALVDLEARYRSGAISEEVFEAEKVKLLGG